MTERFGQGVKPAIDREESRKRSGTSTSEWTFHEQSHFIEFLCSKGDLL
jgi:hypothetical protein